MSSKSDPLVVVAPLDAIEFVSTPTTLVQDAARAYERNVERRLLDSVGTPASAWDLLAHQFVGQEFDWARFTQSLVVS